MLKPILLYGATLPFLFAMDLVWLAIIAKDFYRTQIGYLMRPEVMWAPGILFYLLFLVGILVFAVYPALEAQSLMRAVLLGALFGFLSYAAYDLTNYATVRDWPFMVTVVDMLWGATLAGVISGVSFYLSRFIY